MKKTFIAIVALIIMCTNALAQQNDSKTTLQNILNTYYSLSTALTQENGVLAQQAASDIKKNVEQVNENQLNNNDKLLFLAKKGLILEQVSKIANTKNINLQREALAPLSLAMYELYSILKINKSTVYLQYCPMAIGENGAYWLSNDKKILNPYFGNKMLHCGSVEETF